MNRAQIDRFFWVLARELPRSARIILTGAAAGSLWGSLRPSLDIDFGITLATGGRDRWEAVDAAIQRTVARTGIPANYTEDLDRWGQITLLDYRRHTQPYKRFGRLEVRLLDPAYWSIGKISRYLDPDVQDLVTILKRKHTPTLRLIQVWARALRASPRSPSVFQFRTQVEHFLRTYGRTIWGHRFEPEAAVRAFHRAAGIHQA